MQNELPPFVSTFRDKIGVMRLRFRRAGYSRYLPVELESDEFKDAYAACLVDAPPTPIRSPHSVIGQTRAFLSKHGWSARGEFVYFVATKGMAKIGWSSKLVERVGAIQSASPTRLRLLAAMPGSPETERRLHKLFAEERVKGEWFRLTPRLKAAIAEVNETGTLVDNRLY